MSSDGRCACLHRFDAEDGIRQVLAKLCGRKVNFLERLHIDQKTIDELLAVVGPHYQKAIPDIKPIIPLSKSLYILAEGYGEYTVAEGRFFINILRDALEKDYFDQVSSCDYIRFSCNCS